MESTGEMELALQYYENAGDYLSLVRVHCYCDNLVPTAKAVHYFAIEKSVLNNILIIESLEGWLQQQQQQKF
jgi:hypothetical protein